MDHKSTLLTLLGLPADATDEQIASAAAALKGDKETKATLNARITELQTQLANTDLDAHGIKDETQRKFWAPLLTNADQRPEALKALGAMKAPAQQQAPLHNRNGAPVPGTDRQLSKVDEGADKASTDLHNRAMHYRHQHGGTYEAALAMVRTMPAT